MQSFTQAKPISFYFSPPKPIIMPDKVITHEGVVTKINPTTLEITIIANSACGACHAKSACGFSESEEKILTIPKPTDKNFILQQHVNIKMSLRQGNKAVIYAYAIPFVLLITVLFTLIGLHIDEGLSALFAISCLIPYYIVLYLFRQRLQRKFSYEVE